jgi:hypothetical protein
MKLRITESQLAKIKTQLNEDVDMVAQFEQFCKGKIQEVNKIYMRVSGLSVAEVVNHEVNISDLYNYLSKMENNVMDAKDKAYSYIANLPEADLDLRLDKAYDSVEDKISSLNLILNVLDDLQGVSEEHKLAKSFLDVQPIDITPKEI